MPGYTWSREELEIIKAAWATPHGRAAINVIVERVTGLMRSAFDDNPYRSAFLEGRRSIGCDLSVAVNTPIDKLVQEPDAGHSLPITATERAARASTDAALAHIGKQRRNGRR